MFCSCRGGPFPSLSAPSDVLQVPLSPLCEWQAGPAPCGGGGLHQRPVPVEPLLRQEGPAGPGSEGFLGRRRVFCLSPALSRGTEGGRVAGTWDCCAQKSVVRVLCRGPLCLAKQNQVLSVPRSSGSCCVRPGSVVWWWTSTCACWD